MGGFGDQMCYSVNYRIKVNGEYTNTIVPHRSLRQGDPLSPYLFIICAEGLSAMLQQAELEGKIGGIRVCHAAPSVNHFESRLEGGE